MAKWRILVVDDERDIRTIIRGALSAKYEVVEAVDGLDALQKLELAEPDFVLLDVMMPMMDGYKTCEAIRRNDRYKHVSVMFLSALSTKDEIKRGYSSGADLYLTKPFDPSRLLRNVDLFFDNHSLVHVPKRYTIEQLEEIHRKSSEEIAKAHVDLTASAPPVQDVVPHPTDARGTGTKSGAESAASSAEPATSQPASQSSRNIFSGVSRPRVLLVDSDLELLIACRGVLDEEFEVVQATNGIEGIEKITSYQPDIIMLDAMLPKMSGYQLCQSLRRNQRYAKTPILFVSGKASPRDREYATRIGSNDFLGKPFQITELRDKIHALTQVEGFIVHPKTLTFDMLQEMENKRRRSLEEREDRLHRKEGTEIEKFLRDNS